jgi:glycosyltransferase involved in cell wall biosynthesis
VAVCPARFGEGIVGGAEIVLHKMAEHLQARGIEVEVLTSCALDHHTWENVLPPGESVVDGLKVRRFPAEAVINPEHGALEHIVMSGGRLDLDGQQRWMDTAMRLPGLFHHLLDHVGDYQAVILTPYVAWTSYACSQIDPAATVLWTCLHEEPYAYLEVFQPMLRGVAGLLLQSEPEHDLLHRVTSAPAPHELVGCGVEVPESYDPEGFRRRHGIEGPFVLYAGRREGGKGWDELLRWFADAVTDRRLPLSLVTMGGGAVDPPAEIADRVIDVGFLPDAERDAAFAAATAYVQPSRYEAFSRTIMEAWLAGTPVIANGLCDVVRWHCERSGAGLLYEGPDELAECLTFLSEAPDLAAKLADPGREYVLGQYQWDDVLGRILTSLERWTAP